MEYPKRKRIRLESYDYSSPGAYFITICTHERRCILSDISVGADALGGPLVALTAMGRIVEKYILSTENIPGVHVDKYVIMPNHIHMILTVETVGGPPGGVGPYSGVGSQCDLRLEAPGEQRSGRKHLAALVP